MTGPSAAERLAGRVGDSSLAALGQAPGFAMGVTYLAMAGSLGLAMENAVANQQRGQAIANAAVTQVLALIIKGASKP